VPAVIVPVLGAVVDSYMAWQQGVRGLVVVVDGSTAEF
jgi:hypothetical protein